MSIVAPDVNEVKRQAAGAWPSILATLAPHTASMVERGTKHGPCPLCGGKDRARMMNTFADDGAAICNQCGPAETGGVLPDGFAFLQWANGWTFKEALHEVARIIGAGVQTNPSTQPKRTAKRFNATPTYVYRNGDGTPRFGVVRRPDKTFFQVRPDGDGWVAGLGGVIPCLYHLPELPAAIERGDFVLIPEGEKDVDNLRALGFTATTNPMGAGKWRDEYSESLRGAHAVILPDNDEPGRQHAERVARSLYGVAASVRVLALPDLPEKGDVSDWLKNGGTAEELRAMIEAAPEWEPPEDQSGDNVRMAGDYLARDGVIYRIQYTKEGAPVYIPLCNFDARIVAQTTRDDGAERTVVFEIEGEQHGKRLPRIYVPAERFPAMSWPVTEWGTKAVVYAGHSAKDHLRAAIQLLSEDVQVRTVYGHTGWREIDGRWYYLHGAGAIGTDGNRTDVAVELEQRLRYTILPDPPSGDELRAAIQASLGVRHVAPDRISLPLLAATYRAPLGEVLPIDTVFAAVGPSGTQKTSSIALAQAHFGAGYSFDNLPGHWEGTANALERLAFIAKDMLLVVDDFAPGGGAQDVQRRHRDADRLLRSAANRGGRARMRPDGTLRPELYARGLIASTGEDIPMGKSLRARMLIVEYQRGDVSLPRLTQAQHDAARGLYAASMAGYVRWLAGRLDSLRETLPGRLSELRQAARDAGATYHDGTPSNVASLAIGWELVLSYALDAGAIDEAEAAELWTAGWDALIEVASAQADHIHAEDPVNRFIMLLDAALTSGSAHLADKDTGEVPPEPIRRGWRRDSVGYAPQGPQIGWADDDNIYLQQDAAFATIQRFAREQGTTLPVTQRTLWKQMGDAGLLASRDEGRYTTRIDIGGKRVRVIHLLGSVLYGPETGPTGPSGPEPHNDGLFRPRFVAHSPQFVDQEPGQSGPSGDAAPGHGPVLDQSGPVLVHSFDKVGQAENGSTTGFAGSLVHSDHFVDQGRPTDAEKSATATIGEGDDPW